MSLVEQSRGIASGVPAGISGNTAWGTNYYIKDKGNIERSGSVSKYLQYFYFGQGATATIRY